MECLRALKPFLTPEKLTKFRLIRLEEAGDGTHSARIFSGGDLEASLETDSDFR
jgi:hypothetical protein